MTDSKNENPEATQNRLSSQNEDFDFELADIKIMPDQVDSANLSLDDFVADEAVIDSLLIDDVQQSNAENTAPRYIADPVSPLIPPASVASEIKTNFYVDYFDQRKKSKKIKKTNPESASVVKTNQSTVDDRSQESMIPEKNPATPTEQPTTEESLAPVIDGAGMAVAVLSQFKSKQERINQQQEELIHEFSAKMKSARKTTNTAVFFGVVALVAAAVLGVMLSKTKEEVSDLTGTTTTIKDDIKNIAKISPNDWEGTDPSIDQLNQKVDDVIEQLNEVTARQNQTSSSGKTTDTMPPPVEKTVATVQPETTKPLVNTAITKKKPTPETVAKVTPTKKIVKTAPAEKKATVAQVTTAKPKSNDKRTNKADLYVPKKISDIPDKAMQVPANDINKVVNAAATHAAAPTKPHTDSNSGWIVNLGSSNKLESAKNTAARFAQKGIPVSISSVTVKNKIHYRLQVKGFKTKEEATAYGNKAQDTLKLNSVWINH